jgi:hypothetical protein
MMRVAVISMAAVLAGCGPTLEELRAKGPNQRAAGKGRYEQVGKCFMEQLHEVGFSGHKLLVDHDARKAEILLPPLGVVDVDQVSPDRVEAKIHVRDAMILHQTRSEMMKAAMELCLA